MYQKVQPRDCCEMLAHWLSWWPWPRAAPKHIKPCQAKDLTFGGRGFSIGCRPRSPHPASGWGIERSKPTLTHSSNRSSSGWPELLVEHCRSWAFGCPAAVFLEQSEADHSRCTASIGSSDCCHGLLSPSYHHSKVSLNSYQNYPEYLHCHPCWLTCPKLEAPLLLLALPQD